ncbi:hypothetical protein ES319_A08G020900v1 [Gossypium barbadense]|uniref:Uncharacterized protein n=1 Tax=Gossypium barbadense TaxID=3634 RepID=A0A5J5UJX1_GOSBA|nr:hypothetical protein ES319_A08G020900v1 [Gossypium barbadense]
MSIGAPAATSGTPIAASTPGAPAATPSTSIGTPPLCAPATTPSTPIGAPPPNAPAATVGKPIGAPPPGAHAAAATGAPPPISGASEPGSDDKSAISSSGNQHTTASVESNPTKSINDKPADATPTDKPLADVPSLTPDNQETSVPTTDPTSEPLA